MMWSAWSAALLCWLALMAAPVGAFPVNGNQTVLPVGTELNEDALDRPREVFRSEALGGRKSYLVNLGDVAFSSPAILGGTARQAGISCSTCHVNGASNPKFYLPGLSTRPGNLITTGGLFNFRANNHLLDPVTIPSLRGARYLAPYGHDGRMASLRDFVRNVIANEFAGPEPSPAVLDAMVVYLEDIDFLPNPRLAPGGRLRPQASVPEQRGEALFAKPFPHDPSLSCAGCHVPSGAFIDHRQHDVGSGGLYKTPTLLNADFNAPYFHDGRYETYAQVVAHFDRTFDIGLSVRDQDDLVAYLTAIGDGQQPYERDGVIPRLKEIMDFASVLGAAIPAHDTEIIDLVANTVGGELRELTENFPTRKDTSIFDGREERNLARALLKDLVLCLRRIDLAATAGRFDDAATEYSSFRKLTISTMPVALQNAEPWSLFNPAVHDAHYAALRQMIEAANGAGH
jgi:cytochrome c peroxidase